MYPLIDLSQDNFNENKWKLASKTKRDIKQFESLYKKNIDDHTKHNNWFHRVAGPSIYRALTTRFLILCSWTAYALPHHLSLLQCNVRSIFSREGFHFSFCSHLRLFPTARNPNLFPKINWSQTSLLHFENSNRNLSEIRQNRTHSLDKIVYFSRVFVHFICRKKLYICFEGRKWYIFLVFNLLTDNQ